MKKYLKIHTPTVACLSIVFLLVTISCDSPPKKEVVVEIIKPDTKVEDNIKKYSHIWDEILNKGKLEMFNETNFTKDVLIHANPENVVGIDGARGMYSQFLTGFSDIEFTINDIFGQDDKLVKYWTFKGKHTGEFFGIPASGNSVDLQGTTLVKMKNGKITEEQDFYDNLEFLQQLGVIPRD